MAGWPSHSQHLSGLIEQIQYSQRYYKLAVPSSYIRSTYYLLLYCLIYLHIWSRKETASSLHSLLITAPYLISRSGPHYHQPSHRMTQHARTEVVQLKHCVPYLKWKTLAPNLLSQWLSHRLASETTELDVKRVPLPLVSQLDSGLGYKCFLSLWCAVMGRYIW